MDRIALETAAVARALRERDESTFLHCSRTCALSVQVGQALGLSSSEVVGLRWAAELHDVGKIGIPDRILLKPGRLDEQELQVMRTHSQRGHDILRAVPDAELSAIATTVLHHHEAVDGSGYPQGLRGEGISVLARIVSVVDSYDAIATVRTYNAPKCHLQVMRMLFDEQGRKYDPHVLRAFAKAIECSPYKAAG